ncbi:MAG: metallopeptidase [Clostridia bacterium]|nr:metallopeptidase [Clostridia bacterium]
MSIPQNTDKQALISRLAHDIINLGRNSLFIALRFLDLAFFQFTLEEDRQIEGLRADGRTVFYQPLFIIREYQAEHQRPARLLLHSVLHFVFRHPFVGEKIIRPYWDLACDMAVENSIAEAGIKQAVTARQKQQQDYLFRLKKELPLLSAERIYRYLLDQKPDAEELAAAARLFFQDEHELWYGVGGENTAPNEQETARQTSDAPQPEREKTEGGILPLRLPPSEDKELAERWQQISETVKTDLETMSREWGESSGAFLQNIREVNRDHYDYADFLRRFAVRGEAMQIDDAEFDYIYYNYGMELYGNMPLIEPLEYKEVKKIRDFVIAVDTSASCAGETVQLFLDKTAAILRQTESFFREIRLHIIQCDAALQSDALITSTADFRDYLAKMQIKGLGGTDFRPVFDYVDQLIAGRQLTNLKGLIYFTDGYGRFPARRPAYETAFVFLDEGREPPPIPPWAIKLVLDRREMERLPGLAAGRIHGEKVENEWEKEPQ